MATGNSKGAPPSNRQMQNQGKHKGRRKNKGILQKKIFLYKVVPGPDNLAKCQEPEKYKLILKRKRRRLPKIIPKHSLCTVDVVDGTGPWGPSWKSVDRRSRMGFDLDELCGMGGGG